MFIIERPIIIDKFISNSNQPLMFTRVPARAVNLKANVTLPTILPMPQSDNLHAFNLQGVSLEAEYADPEKTNGCGGKLCDGYENPVKCPCVKIVDRSCSMIIKIVLKVTSSQGNVNFVTFTSEGFSSKKLTKLFIAGGEVPTGFNVTSLTNDRLQMNRFLDAIDNVIQFYNSRNGFDVLGWIRRGQIADPGVDALTKRDRVFIDSGEVQYHLTSVTPSHCVLSQNDQESLEALKYDLRGLNLNQQAAGLNNGNQDPAPNGNNQA